MSLGRDLSRIDVLMEIERIKQMLEAVLEEVMILNQVMCLVAGKVGVDEAVLNDLCLMEVSRE